MEALIVFCSLSYFFIALVSRLYKVSSPDVVVWDEAHFGKMVNWYLNGSCFFDVHPPVGKLLFTGCAFLTGYNGSETFNQPGDKYNSSLYVVLRSLSAIAGSAAITFTSLTAITISKSITAAFYVAVMVTLDSSLITISQYILLDPFYLLFQSLCVFGLSLRHSRYSNVALLLIGFSMVGAVGTKLVGIFLVFVVCMFLLHDLLCLISDTRLACCQFFYWIIRRILCIVILPCFIYVAIFWFHFHLLTNSGPGDVFFSPHFQFTLHGNSLNGLYQNQWIHFGSEVTVKNMQFGGAYLHSHFLKYPLHVCSNQTQQVTGYSYKDTQNVWKVSSVLEPKLRMAKNKDVFALQHKYTNFYLSVFPGSSTLSYLHFLVGAKNITWHGNEDTFPKEALWQVQLDSYHDAMIQNWEALGNIFKLKNMQYNCSLAMNLIDLPRWAWQQYEVLCSRRELDNRALWVIETNTVASASESLMSHIAPSFLMKFLEYHLLIGNSDKQLLPRPGEISSKPQQWPFNSRVQPLLGKPQKIVLQGTSFIWNLNLCVLIIFPLLYLCVCAWRKRVTAMYGCLSQKCALKFHTLDQCAFLYLGWIIHYVPFFLMKRTLYFHHYLPALLFSSLLSGIFIDWALNCVFQSSVYILSAYICFVSAALYSFSCVVGTTYGLEN